MQKLSDLVNEKYKTDKTIVGKENSLPKTKLEENLLTAILKPIGIYFIFTWLGNLAYNFQSYLDGRDYNLSKALRRIVESGINDNNLATKLDSAYFSGANLNTLVNIYMDSNIIKRNIDKELKKNKDQIFKNVWTDNIQGEKIKVLRTLTDNEEGRTIANKIYDLNESVNRRTGGDSVNHTRKKHQRTPHEIVLQKYHTSIPPSQFIGSFY